MRSLEVKEGGGKSPSRMKSYFKWFSRLIDSYNKETNPEAKKRMKQTMKDLSELE